MNSLTITTEQQNLSCLVPMSQGAWVNLKSDQAFIDYTYIHFSGFSNAHKPIGLNNYVQQFGLDMNKLPGIVEPWQVIGEVSEQACQRFWACTRNP